MRKVLTNCYKSVLWALLAVVVSFERKEAARKIINKLNAMVDWSDFRTYGRRPKHLRVMSTDKFVAVKVNGSFPMGFNL